MTLMKIANNTDLQWGWFQDSLNYIKGKNLHLLYIIFSEAGSVRKSINEDQPAGGLSQAVRSLSKGQAITHFQVKVQLKSTKVILWRATNRLLFYHRFISFFLLNSFHIGFPIFNLLLWHLHTTKVFARFCQDRMTVVGPIHYEGHYPLYDHIKWVTKDLVMGLGQKNFCSGQFNHLLAWKIYLKIPNFSIFLLRVKKSFIGSGQKITIQSQVGSLFTAYQKHPRIGLSQSPSIIWF